MWKARPAGQEKKSALSHYCSLKLDDQAHRIMSTTTKRYQCLYVDLKDTDIDTDRNKFDLSQKV